MATARVCASVLDALIHAVVGGPAPPPSSEPCCLLIAGLADVDAAVCICLAIKASVLGDGVKLDDVAVDLPLLVNYCGRNVPEGFKCA
uniref:Bifunctional inhibitor/plant lipid transfer protein/seed storage helical domain-containing protein n=1 Tax=Oryza glumipatula TaxID=40148 RepID=A0A0E0AUL6_9ORYZ